MVYAFGAIAFGVMVLLYNPVVYSFDLLPFMFARSITVAAGFFTFAVVVICGILVLRMYRVSDKAVE
jgi:hypothetical protein